MSEPTPLEVIFFAALDKPAAERGSYLAEACRGDVDLRRRVERMLTAQLDAASFLETPPSAIVREAIPTIDQAPLEKPGTQIGPYKLLQQIGEGGMGVVYMAEQLEPVKRRVALKIIKPGMDTRQVIARFEAERQALSLMDHPNIAKVLDAGTTGSGRPYFVMELVKGQPITQYCDENHLTPRQRLELLLPVCQAIQHAHQKGIIHRDIKPTNILVAEYDQQPVPKVIDFGVAKATSQTLTEKTMFTGLGQIVGTLEYMSPEQAKVNQLDIDTRSDIYSLGVLLYELLTGSTPFDRNRLRSAAFDEMLRIIREEEPPKPSTRLSDSQDSLPSISAQRHTEPAKLTRLVRGELDWIVMKALEKDRSRRYETVSAFAADVQHYLNDESVVACPPSASYRLAKFVRRNKGRLALAAMVLFFLVLLGSVAGWAVRDRAARVAAADKERQNREAEAARQRGERQSKVAGQVESILGEVDLLEKAQKWPEALDTARRAGVAVASGEADAHTAEQVRQRLKDLEFIDRLEHIHLEEEVASAKRDQDYARAFRDYGVDVDELAVEMSIQHLKARPALAIPVAAALDEWADSRRLRSKDDDAPWKRLVAIARGIDQEPLRDRLRLAPRPLPPQMREELQRLAESIDVRAHHPATLSLLASTLRGDSAISLLRRAQAVYPGDFSINYELGGALYDARYQRKQNSEEAIRFWTVAVALRPSAAKWGPAWLIPSLFRERGDLDEAIAAYRQTIEAEPESFGPRWVVIGDILRDQKKPAEAADAYRKAIAAYRKEIEAKPEQALGPMMSIGRILAGNVGKPDEALTLYRQHIKDRPEGAGACWRAIGDILRDQQKPAEAADAYGKAVAAFRKDYEANPSERAIVQALDDLLRAQGKLDELIAVYRQAIKANPDLAKTHFRSIGDLLRTQGKLDEAITEYRNAIVAKPDSGQYYDFQIIGDILVAQGKPDEAVPEYIQAFAARASQKDVNQFSLTPIGRTLIARGKVDEAIALHRPLLAAGPEVASTYLSAIGDILRQQKNSAKAAEAYRKAIEQKLSPAVYHQLGLALRDLKKQTEANAAFDRAIELYRESTDLVSAPRYTRIGVVLRDKGELDEAIAAFRKALDITPTDGSLLRDLVSALRARGRPDEAIDAYRKAVEANPRDFENLNALGDALRELGKGDEAIAVYRRAIDVAPTPNFAAGIYLDIGNVLLGQKKMPEAIAAYYRVVELDPSDRIAPAAYINIGFVLRDWRKPDEAIDSFRKAMSFNNPNATAAAHLHIGYVLLQQNKLDEAIDSYRKAIAINDPKITPGAHMNLGDVLVRQNKLEEGIAEYRKVIELNLDSPITCNKLAWILATRSEVNLREPKEAVALAKRAVELKPAEGLFWNTLGVAQYRAGDWKEAVAGLEKSMELRKGGDSHDWFFVAMAYWQLGEKVKAREWYDRGVEWMEAKSKDNAELIRFRAEAEELMK